MTCGASQTVKRILTKMHVVCMVCILAVTVQLGNNNSPESPLLNYFQPENNARLTETLLNQYSTEVLILNNAENGLFEIYL